MRRQFTRICGLSRPGTSTGRLIAHTKKMHSLPSPRTVRRIRHIAALIGAALPLACTSLQPPSAGNPFLGDWAGAKNASITIRPDTVVQHQPDGESTTLDGATCAGV